MPNPFSPPPPAVPSDGTPFSDPAWQRWFAGIGSGLQRLFSKPWQLDSGQTWSWLRTSDGLPLLSLDSNGTLTAVKVGQTSDERLKYRWRRLAPDFVEGLAGLKEANRAGSFAWRAGGVRAVGVGAQAVARFCPLAVLEGSDGLKRVEYGVLGTLGAVALAERMLKAEARVKSLEASVCALQEAVARFEVREGLR